MPKIIRWQMSSSSSSSSSSPPVTHVWLASSGSLPTGRSLTRASAALDLTGASFAAALYTSSAINVARYARLRDGTIGLTLEGAETNLAIESYNLAGTGWVDLGGSPSPALNEAGLTGAANTASTLTDAASGGQPRRRQIITVPGGIVQLCWQVFIKKDAVTSRFPVIETDTGVAFSYQLNTSTGATGVANAGTGWTVAPAVTVLDLPGWWNMWVVGTKPATHSSKGHIVGPAAGSVLGTPSSTPIGSIVVAHAALATSGYPTSPVVTTGTSAARSADIAGGTVSAEGSGWTMVLRARTAYGKAGDQYLYQRDNGTANNRVTLRRNSSGAIVLDVLSGGVSQCSVTGAVIADETTFNVAFSVNTNDFGLCVDGVSATRDTAGTLPGSLVNERWGSDHAGANNWNGWLLGGSLALSTSSLAATDDAGLEDLLDTFFS